MLIGNFLVKLDKKKGRTALPKKFRSILGRKVIVTLGYENTLMVISSESWEKVVGEIVNQPFISGPARETDRFLLGSAFKVDLDSQGRFIIPKSLRKHAGLGEDIVFVGVGNRVEIWGLGSWEKHLQYLDANIARISQELDEADKNK